MTASSHSIKYGQVRRRKIEGLLAILSK